ncbi:MAG: protein-L-isoaspartate(D-aspartate) O-methyltransferase [Deltaproteobacteria bacterium]|nr:protein-L-isoaspartate(D-aspartate) O-methyltransferase [Deltaproteobacteria bacterium]
MEDSFKFERLRLNMIETQLKPRGITDQKVIKAISKIPRHLFVDEALAEQAYADHPLPIGEGQTISQPYIVAEMTQALMLNKDDRVLEIGTGSGYQAAVLSKIAFKVYTIETIHSLYTKARSLFDRLGYYNIVTKYSDGTSGWKEEAPFDAIIVTAGAPDIPENLIKNLAVSGKMIIPVGSLDFQELIKIYKKSETELTTEKLGDCRFVKLTGEQGWKC